MNLPPQLKNFIYSPTKEGLPQKLNYRNLAFISVGGLLLLLSVLLLNLPKINQASQPTPSTTNPQTDINKAKKQSAQASASAQQANNPLNRLEEAYLAVVGSDDLKKNFSLSDSGVATIDYVITSTDGTTILKTSFENFADLATRVFNIPSVQRLNVSTYAYKFTDSYGNPNIAAVHLEVSRTTNAKINWAVKKYSYKDYASILDVEQINPQLTKDYSNLIKSS